VTKRDASRRESATNAANSTAKSSGAKELCFERAIILHKGGTGPEKGREGKDVVEVEKSMKGSSSMG
jgi:hypothetical protein